MESDTTWIHGDAVHSNLMSWAYITEMKIKRYKQWKHNKHDMDRDQFEPWQRCRYILAQIRISISAMETEPGHIWITIV